MTVELLNPPHIDEPHDAQEYAEMLGSVAANGQAVIVQRDGADLAAVIPLVYLDLLRDMVAREEAEALAATINWDRVVKEHPPNKEWFERDEPKPF
jgi:hypothetical protein